MSNRMRSEAGFSIMEVMVAVVILALVGLASAKNSIMSMSTFKRSMRNSIAMQLAVEKLEELGSVNPTTLDNSDDSTEANVVEDNITFTRVTQVTQNADESRTVTVTVNANDADLGGTYEVTNTFPLWGNK